MRYLLMLLGSSLCALVGLTQALAWQWGYHPLLGPPLVTWQAFWIRHGLYAPWQGLGWLWQWGLPPWPLLRAALLVSVVCGGVGLLGGALTGAAGRSTGSRWGTWCDLWHLGLFQRGGVVLGTRGGWIVGHRQPAHTLVVASTQSGKTTSLVIPTLLEWPESVLVLDPKGELFPATAGSRAGFSRVVGLYPATPGGACYNPLDAIRFHTPHRYADLDLLSEFLADPDGDGFESEAAQHFGQQAMTVYTGLLEYGLKTGAVAHLGDLYALGQRSLHQELLPRLAELAPDCPAVQEVCTLIADTPKRELGGVVQTVRRGLRLWRDPRIVQLTAHSDFALEDLRNGATPLSLYLGVPFSAQARLRVLVRLCLGQWLQYATEEHATGRWRLLGMIEELLSLRRFVPLSEGLDYFAGRGVILCLVTPSLHRLAGLYGKDHNFLEGCAYQVIFGINDDTVAASFARRGGAEVITQRRRAWTQSARGTSRTVSYDTTERPLLRPTDLMQMDPDEVLLFVRNSPPFRLHKQPYWRSRRWAARANLEVLHGES